VAIWLALQDDEVRRFLLPGLVSIGIAVLAWLADRKQMRRTDPDATGLIAWREVSFWASLAAIILLGMAVRSGLWPD
jgi:uncharacterized SAM-binding protein YcdF (DUF218 family)